MPFCSCLSIHWKVLEKLYDVLEVRVLKLGFSISCQCFPSWLWPEGNLFAFIYCDRKRFSGLINFHGMQSLAQMQSRTLQKDYRKISRMEYDWCSRQYITVFVRRGSYLLCEIDYNTILHFGLIWALDFALMINFLIIFSQK